MSSARKRSAIKKANNEVEHLKQKIMLTEHHANVMESMAMMAALKYDEKHIELHELKMKYCPETLTEKDHELYERLKKQLEQHKNPPKPEPVQQLIFAEEDYHEASNMAIRAN